MNKEIQTTNMATKRRNQINPKLLFFTITLSAEPSADKETTFFEKKSLSMKDHFP